MSSGESFETADEKRPCEVSASELGNQKWDVGFVLVGFEELGEAGHGRWERQIVCMTAIHMIRPSSLGFPLTMTSCASR